MSETNHEADISECLLETIFGFMVPFFLAAAQGNPDLARATVRQLINAYNPGSPTELDLAGRIVGFSIVAMDNLRLSMTQGLSDTKILRYRGNAVVLSRAAEQSRKILEATRTQPDAAHKIPRPAIAAAPPPAPAKPTPQTATTPPMDVEAMKRDARILMQAFSRNGPQASASILAIPDPATLAKAAAAQAVAAIRRTSAA
jgi:hypothetical protein